MNSKVSALDKIQEKRERLLAIALKYGASNVRVFGSVTRKEEKDDSDVDFLVEMEKGRSMIDLIALEEAFKSELGCDVDVVTVPSLNRHIKGKVMDEAISL